MGTAIDYEADALISSIRLISQRTSAYSAFSGLY
jgi:hypothetical protein